MSQIRIVAIERWRRMSGAAKKRWIESAVEEALTRQWALNGKPLYTYSRDVFPGDYRGNNQPGWDVALAVPLTPKPDAIKTYDTVVGPTPGVKAWAYQGVPVFTYKWEDRPGQMEADQINVQQAGTWLSIDADGYDINQPEKESRAASR